MEKTKLGLSVEIMAAAVVLATFFGGYTGMILVVGYVLLAEDNAWLKKLAVKVAVLTVALSFISSAVYLLPNAVTCIDSLFRLIGLDFSIPMINQLVKAFSNILNIVESVIFLVMGYQALTHKELKIAAVDSFVEKHFGA
jgi:hypothetical protein